ncbi:MAG: hypothetical protein H6629_18135 [Calditrichae bacterium]|nr:hypothetical protein [Calditrichia bacterium]
MIKLFRKFAKAYFPMAKIKYLKYAVGEIILVIIGILIAVSINDWNGDRKLKIEQQFILKDLKQEMTENLKALETAIKGNEKSFQTALKIRALLMTQKLLIKCQIVYFFASVVKMNFNYTYDPQYGILNSIISSGQINRLSIKRAQIFISFHKGIDNRCFRRRIENRSSKR